MNDPISNIAGYTWGPPLFALLAGAVLGYWLWRKWHDAGSVPSGRVALETRHAAVMDELRLLLADEDRLDPEEFRQQRDQRVAEAANLLRELEALPAQAEVRRPLGLLLPVSVGVVGIVVLGLAWQSQQTLIKAAEAELAQESAEMMNPHQMARAAAQDAEPMDLDTLNELAREALLAGQLPTAMQLIEQARAVAPDDPLVQVHVNALRLGVGMLDRAEPGLAAVLEAHPDLLEAHLWMGVLRMQQGDMAAAEAHFRRVSAAEPDGEAAQFLRMIMAEMAGPADGVEDTPTMGGSLGR